MSSQTPQTPVPLRPAEKVRSFLGWAFVLSLAIHLVFGPILGQFKPPQQAEKEVEKVSVSKKTKVIVPTPPPPSPTPPPPTPAPKTTPPPVKQTNPPPQPKLKVQPPKTHAISAGGPTEHQYNVTKGSENGVPQGSLASGNAVPAGNGVPATTAPSPVPTPAPTQRPSCPVPNADAAIKGSPVEPDYPDIARQQGLAGVTQVKVTLDTKGNVTDTSVYKSAGAAVLDQAAIKAARQTSYTPEITDCQPVGGSYIFRAEFTAQ